MGRTGPKCSSEHSLRRQGIKVFSRLFSWNLMFPKELGKKHNTVKLTEIHAASHLSQDPKWSWSALCLWRHHRIAAGATMCENPQGASIWDGLGIDGRLLRLQKHQKRCHWRPCGAKVHSCLLGRFFMRWYKMYALEMVNIYWEKKVTVDSAIAKPMARKASHKKWPQAFVWWLSPIAVWRYRSEIVFLSSMSGTVPPTTFVMMVPAWATLRLFCTAAEQDDGLVGKHAWG